MPRKLTHGDFRPDNGAIVLVHGAAHDTGPVNLDDIDRKGCQVAQR